MSEQINTTEEVWKTIAEFPTYSVSTHGRVRRDVPIRRRPAFSLMKPHIDRVGYVVYQLYNSNGHCRCRFAHRLVAMSFIEPDPARPEVNHKDGIKSNNYVWNLEWATPKENVRHSLDVLGKKPIVGERNGNSRLRVSDVVMIRELLKTTTQSAIARMFGVTQENISMIKSGQTWRHVPD